MDALDVFIGDGRDQHDARGRFSVEGFCLQIGHVLREFFPEVFDTCLAGEGFVEAVGGEDDVGLRQGEVLLGVGEIGRPGLHLDGIGRPGQISHLQLVVGKMLVQEGFEIGEILGAVEEGVADEGDAGAFGDVERQAGFDGGRSLRPGGRLLVDGVLCQAGILDDRLFPRLAIPAVRGVRFLSFRLFPRLALRLRGRELLRNGADGDYQSGEQETGHK